MPQGCVPPGSWHPCREGSIPAFLLLYVIVAQAEPCSSVVRSVEFHSNGQLLLVAGLDKR